MEGRFTLTDSDVAGIIYGWTATEGLILRLWWRNGGTVRPGWIPAKAEKGSSFSP